MFLNKSFDYEDQCAKYYFYIYIYLLIILTPFLSLHHVVEKANVKHDCELVFCVFAHSMIYFSVK